MVGTFVILPLGLYYFCSFPFWIKRRTDFPAETSGRAYGHLSVCCTDCVAYVLGAIAPRLELAPEETPAAEQTVPSQGKTQEETSEDTGGFLILVLELEIV